MLNYIFLFITLFFSSYGLIIHYDFTQGLLPNSYQTFSGVAMYSSKDAPAFYSDYGDGESYIKLDIEISRNTTNTEAQLDVVIIPDTSIQDIGLYDEDILHLCCSYDLVVKNLCKSEEMNHLIISKDIKGLYRFYVKFFPGEGTKHLLAKTRINVTNIHVFAVASCNKDLGTITFQGESIWMNPYGHLPGDMYGYLPFYGLMCIVYLVIAFFWIILNVVYRKQLLYIQNCITGVLAICLIEMATWYFDYLHLNQKGFRHHGPFIIGLITTVTRCTISRMLVVAVAIGYGIVNPTLDNITKWKIIGLGILYWIFSFMFEAIIHYNQTEKVNLWVRVILIPPVTILNAIFWWWTFVCLNRTIDYLKLRKQTAKLYLYKAFTIVLVITLIAAIIFIIYELYYISKELYFDKWQRLWFMEVGFWQILFSAILIAIMILWRPSKHSKNYAYAEQIRNTSDEIDENIGINDEDEDEDENENRNKNDNTAYNFKKIEPKFVIDEEDDDDDDDDNNNDNNKLLPPTIQMDTKK